MNDIVRELDNVIKKYKYKAFFTGELNFVEMAKSCKIIIQDLLQEKAERENPKPLTLEELRERDGKPVWITGIYSKSGIWTLVETKVLSGLVKSFYNTKRYFDDYGINWLAYDHEPKEG
ncbi:hypothetical protein [Anaerovorax odorimutans]|uniref:hypothetical protein n=1 Tax=Anaerovorax odorimutans TaxID=109327 RepID=UPI0003F557D1|nr:hypothetical protein [Anaerovorax odorimutans]